jgi:hypothetical protein
LTEMIKFQTIAYKIDQISGTGRKGFNIRYPMFWERYIVYVSIVLKRFFYLVSRLIRLTFLARTEISPRTVLTMAMSSSGPSLSGVTREYHRSVTHSVTRCLENCSNAASTGGELTLLLQLEFPSFWVRKTFFNSVLLVFTSGRLLSRSVLVVLFLWRS